LEERVEEVDTPRCTLAPPLASTRFPALKKITLHGRPSAVLNVLNGMHATLKHLDITLRSDHYDTPERIVTHHYADLAELITKHFSQLETLGL